jgi:hypothetical protein
LDQLVHEWRWFEAKLLTQKPLVLAVGADSLRCVSLSDLHLHNEATRAFAERLGLYRGQRCDERITEVASLYQSRRCALKCFQSQQTVTLPISYHPFVIPVRQKFDTLD